MKKLIYHLPFTIYQKPIFNPLLLKNGLRIICSELITENRERMSE